MDETHAKAQGCKENYERVETLPLRFVPMAESYAREIVEWQYDGPYSIYNVLGEYDGESEQERMAREQSVRWLVDPHNRYYAALDEAGALFGFCCFGHDARVSGGDYMLDGEPGTFLDVGLGMRPALTGQGRGTSFLRAILAFARVELEATRFRATIAGFNRRSQRIFLRAGFQPVRTFVSTYSPPLEFVVMRR